MPFVQLSPCGIVKLRNEATLPSIAVAGLAHLGERWPSRLVATAAEEDRMSFRDGKPAHVVCGIMAAAR